jgi:hypothetical protein
MLVPSKWLRAGDEVTKNVLSWSSMLATRWNAVVGKPSCTITTMVAVKVQNLAKFNSRPIPQMLGHLDGNEDPE